MLKTPAADLKLIKWAITINSSTVKAIPRLVLMHSCLPGNRMHNIKSTIGKSGDDAFCNRAMGRIPPPQMWEDHKPLKATFSTISTPKIAVGW